jgi:hypothetical protein
MTSDNGCSITGGEDDLIDIVMRSFLPKRVTVKSGLTYYTHEPVSHHA